VKRQKPIHHSRSELLTLLYDKLQRIHDEVEHAQDGGEQSYTGRKLKTLKQRMTLISVESKRCLALIDDYETHWMAGTCLHCRRPFAEHSEFGFKMPDVPRVTTKMDNDDETRPPYCYGQVDRYESLELATYQGLPESAGEG